MKKSIQFLVLIFIILCSFSCKPPVELSISNELENVTVENITWSGSLVSYKLLPGQEGSVEFNPSNVPDPGYIYFEMAGFQRRLALRTVDVISLGESMHIKIDSTLEVITP